MGRKIYSVNCQNKRGKNPGIKKGERGEKKKKSQNIAEKIH